VINSQLPPVEGEPWFQTSDPDVQLDEIVRTAAASEITALATMIRQHDARWKKHAWSKEVTILTRSAALADQQLWRDADITLAHQNATCDQFNAMIRDYKHLAGTADPTRPVAGDSLLAWEAMKTHNIKKSEIYAVAGSMPLAGGYTVRLLCPYTGQLSMVAVNKATLLNQKSEIKVDGFHPFSYASAITGHKSQGSEWDNVIVLVCDKRRSHEDYWNWVYTSCTRAKKHLTIII
jgi:exodeoxyribonuclease-5